MVSHWVWVARYAQSTQKKTSFVLPLQYLKESIKDEVDFLPAYKPQRFLQIDTIILGTCGQSWPNHPK